MDELQPTLEQSIETIVAELPVPVQQFILGPDRGPKILELSQKYRLHADQAAHFEHAFLFMLMGLTSPADFSTELKDAGVADSAVQGLIHDVNEDVFKKLREQERGGREVAITTSQSVSTDEFLPIVVPEAEVEVPAPAYQTPPPTFAVPPPTPVIAPAPILAPVAQPAAEPTPAPSVRTMQSDMSMMKSGTFPESRPASPSPWEAPQQTFVAAQPAPAAVRMPAPEIKKEYGSDPYREPVV